MFEKWLKYSYAAQKNKRHRLRRVVIWVSVFFIIYTAFSLLVFSMQILESNAMQPGLNAGERFIFSSYKIYSLLPGAAPDKLPIRRGNIVLINRADDKQSSFFLLFADSALRFFTIQRFGLESGKKQVHVKRVIGLPGDEVSMVNFVIRVMPRGDNYSFTESELWDRPYVPHIPSVPALWDESFPFSGNMDKIILGEDEYFALSDDRGNTNDSRTWGPVKVKQIDGKLLFRYWPLKRIGRP
ncbi:MAG: signal peptidase I [Treponema sp.]|jgi:signal peptidase I|nr:signal peptidase I [Treponema sp.]